jgi:HSP20 family protein
MVEVNMKADPTRPGWYITDDVQALAPGTGRWRMAMRSHVWRPPTDVYETEEAIIIRIEIAGMQDEDFSISLSDRYLVVRGVRPDLSERRAYHQMEIYFGEFMSEVDLPVPVVTERVKAEYNLGFLRVELPKDRPQRIKVVD